MNQPQVSTFFMLCTPDYAWVQNWVGSSHKPAVKICVCVCVCVCLNTLGSTEDLGGGRGPDRPFPWAGSSHHRVRKAAREQQSQHRLDWRPRKRIWGPVGPAARFVPRAHRPVGPHRPPGRARPRAPGAPRKPPLGPQVPLWPHHAPGLSGPLWRQCQNCLQLTCH